MKHFKEVVSHQPRPVKETCVLLCTMQFHISYPCYVDVSDKLILLMFLALLAFAADIHSKAALKLRLARGLAVGAHVASSPTGEVSDLQ